MSGLWTKEQDQLLQEELSRGSSVAEIANLLGRSISSIKNRRHRLGIKSTLNPKRSWTSEEELLLRSLVSQGTSIVDIAETLERSVIAVRGKAYKLDLSLAQLNQDSCLLYLIEAVDLDGTVFNKVGITTQGSVKDRFKIRDYKVLAELRSNLDTCRSLEEIIKNNRELVYVPKDPVFDRGPKGHSGKSECFIPTSGVELEILIEGFINCG